MKKNETKPNLFTLTLFILAIALVGPSCEGELDPSKIGGGGGPHGRDSHDNGDSADFSSEEINSYVDADLQSAKAVIITPTDNDENDTSLYVMHEDDSSSQIDISKSGSKRLKPKAIFQTKKYVVINYDPWGYPKPVFQGKTCSIVLARKVDGALFCVESSLNCWSNCDDRTVQTDGSGDLIYVGNNFLQKIDMRREGQPTSTMIVEEQLDGWLNEFAVNDQGDALVAINSEDYSARYVRTYYENGGFSSLASGWGPGCLLRGPENQANSFFYIDNSDQKIYEVSKNGRDYVKSIYYDYSWYVPDRVDIGYIDCWGESVFARTEGAIYVRNKWDNSFVSIVNSTGKPVKYTVSGVDRLISIAGYGSTLVFLGLDELGNNSIIRYNVSTYEVDHLFQGLYSIYSIGVAFGGEVTFSGIRAADGARVLGQISEGTNQVTVAVKDFGRARRILRMN